MQKPLTSSRMSLVAHSFQMGQTDGSSKLVHEAVSWDTTSILLAECLVSLLPTGCVSDFIKGLVGWTIM